MAQLMRPASSEPEGAGPTKADDLMRRRSADSIMASVEHPSTHQQAGYMCASLSRCSIEESSCIRGGSIYAPIFRMFVTTTLAEG